MSEKEFRKFLLVQQKKIQEASKEFDHHSKEFDKRIDRLLANL